jgi:hypothetical protein
MKTNHYSCQSIHCCPALSKGRALFVVAALFFSALSASAQLAPQVAAPVFSPKSGEYGTALSVSITTATSKASIRYTTNGQSPTETVGTLYSGPVSIAGTTQFRAIAFKSGLRDSQLRFASYVIGPNFSLSIGPASRTLIAGQSTTFTVTVTPLFGFHDAVDLSFFDPPPGVTATFTPSSIAGGSGTSTMTVKTNILASGTYSDFFVEGETATLSHAEAFALGVEPPPWAPGISYPAGIQVTYQGHTYFSLQASVSQAAYPPPTLPLVWNFNF